MFYTLESIIKFELLIFDGYRLIKTYNKIWSYVRLFNFISVPYIFYINFRSLFNKRYDLISHKFIEIKIEQFKRNHPLYLYIHYKNS